MLHNDYPIESKLRKETIIVTVKHELEKDLQENEEICPNCKGTGLNIHDNVYGISNNKNVIGIRKPLFPYKNPSLGFCQHCYNGVLKKCSKCGKLKTRNEQYCSCGHDRYIQEQKQIEKNNLAWENVKKIKYNTDEYLTYDFEMLYIEQFDKFVKVDYDDSEVYDLLSDYNFDFSDDKLDIKDLHIYATTELKINIDAYSMVMQACEDLHEDAFDSISNTDISILQDMINDWIEKQLNTTSYVPNYKVGIIFE